MLSFQTPLSDIFISNIENNFLASTYSKRIFFQYRYVDIFDCFTTDEADLYNILSHLNNIHSKIKMYQ